MPPYDRSKRSIVKHKTNKPFTAAHTANGAARGGDESQSRAYTHTSSGGGRGHGPEAGRGGSRGRGGGRGRGAGGSSRGKGFKVGPSHAPDGAYLGKAKKIKANLIANAKTKQKYYKSLQTSDNGYGDRTGKSRTDAKRSGGDDDDSDADAADVGAEAGPSDYSHRTAKVAADAPLGRFAPEGGFAPDEDVSRPRSRRQGQGRADDDGLEEERRQTRVGPAPSTRKRERQSHQDDIEDAQRARSSPYERPSSSRTPATTPSTRAGVGEAASRPVRPQRTREEAQEARRQRQEQWNAPSKSVEGQRRGQPDLGSRMQVLLGRIKDQQP